MTIGNIFSIQILLLLFPGFITTAIITNLIPTDRKRGIDKIIESSDKIVGGKANLTATRLIKIR